MLHICAEWEQTSGRVLSLRDDDSQSLIDGEWRRINTLSYYKVMKVPTSVLVFYVSGCLHRQVTIVIKPNF